MKIMRYSIVLAALALGALSGAGGCTLTAGDFEPAVVAHDDRGDTAQVEAPMPNPGTALRPDAAAPVECDGSSEIAGCAATFTPPGAEPRVPENATARGAAGQDAAGQDAAAEDAELDDVGTSNESSCGGSAASSSASALDCGPSSCPACATGQRCAGDDDCASRVCGPSCEPGVALCCQAARCDDGVLNGSESGVDCGDASCGPCPLGRACRADAQCQSAFCELGICTTPTCEDGARGGTESDIDCGGTCPPCAPGSICSADSDCQSGVCEEGRCCGDRFGDCTRCARRLAPAISCELNDDPAVAATCNAFLDCLADDPTVCSVRHAPGCSDAGGVCDHTGFGGNGGAALVLADAILGTAQCFF